MRVAGLFLVAALAIPAQAGLVVGNDQSGTATIYEVDVSTGVATPIYAATTSEAKPWGMAYDAATNTLYWNNGATLYSSPFQNPLVPTNLGGMTYNAATINFVGLAFKGGKLYGTRNIATEAVYAIDPISRVATLEYQYPSTFDFGGLDFDATNGLLYGLSDTAPAGQVRGLYQIDTAGGTTAFLAGYPGAETDIDGLAVHNGVAYYVTDGPFTSQPNLYMYKVADGTLIGTLPSPFTGSGTFSAATFVPDGCRGDADCDGDIDFFDIDPFVAKLGCPGDPSCDAGCPWQNSDADGDGDVDFFDIDPFVALLGTTCP